MIAGVSYLFATFSVGFATTGYKLDRGTMLWVPVLASLLALFYTPVAGLLADRIGRKTVFIIGAAGAGLTTAPYLWAITQGNWPLIFVLGVLCNGFSTPRRTPPGRRSSPRCSRTACACPDWR